MLAFQDEAAIEQILGGVLQPRTPRTETDPAQLRKALARVRKTGYAVEDEQSEAGMRSLAAPIRDAEGRVVAAVGIAGPRQRLSEDVLAQFAPRVVETAQTISARLGYRAANF